MNSPRTRGDAERGQWVRDIRDWPPREGLVVVRMLIPGAGSYSQPGHASTEAVGLLSLTQDFLTPEEVGGLSAL